MQLGAALRRSGGPGEWDKFERAIGKTLPLAMRLPMRLTLPLLPAVLPTAAHAPHPGRRRDTCDAAAVIYTWIVGAGSRGESSSGSCTNELKHASVSCDKTTEDTAATTCCGELGPTVAAPVRWWSWKDERNQRDQRDEEGQRAELKEHRQGGAQQCAGYVSGRVNALAMQHFPMWTVQDSTLAKTDGLKARLKVRPSCIYIITMNASYTRNSVSLSNDF